MININLLLFAVDTAAAKVNRRGHAAFRDSVRTPQAGADVRRYGLENAAEAYGLRQEMDRWLFTESLVSVVSKDGKPSNDQIQNVIGEHRRRWNK